MPHVGNADRLVHTFIVYDDDVLPGLKGKIIGVNALQRRLHVTRFERGINPRSARWRKSRFS